MKNNKIVDKVDSSFEAIADWSIKWRWLVVAFSVVLVVVGVYFAGKAHPDNSLDAYFDKTDPAYIAYLEYLNDFSSDEVHYILYRAPDKTHGPFDLETMAKIGKLTQALEDEVPFVHEATSLANVEFISSEGDDINIQELLLDFPETQEELLAIREIVLSKPLYVNYLINKEADYAAIIVEMERTSIDPLEKIIYDPEKGDGLDNLYPQVSDDKVREILARPEYAGIEFFLTGDVPMNTAYNRIIMADTGVIMLITLGLIMLVSFILFRATWVGILGPIAVVVISIILTVGVMGFSGWDIGLFFAMLPTLLCAVGVAQSVHILLEYQRSLGETGDRNLAVKAALKKVGGPCLMAAVTTAAGFAVMSVSELKAVGELAIYSSIGVLITFLFSVTLLVVFLSRGENSAKRIVKDKKRHGMKVNPLITSLVKHTIAVDLKYGRAILALALIAFALAAVGLTKLRVDFNFLTEFKPHVEWRQHTELAESVMGGILNVTYQLETNRANGVKDPEFLHALEKVQRFAEQDPLVKKSYSVTDIIKDLNQSFHGDDPAYYRIPDDRELIAQYFLVYEISGGEELEEFVTLDFSRTVMELRVEITDGSNVVALVNKIDQYLEENPIPGATIEKTGIGLLWVKICEYIANTQTVSYSLVFAMVACFMCISFGSIRVGMLSMIPNLAPVIITLGVMGWFDIHLDYMKMLLATIAIGIAVDDTIHLVTRFRKRFYETGNYEKALELSLVDVGPALVITSIILVVSFSSYLLSDMMVLASFGLLLGGAIITALLADLFLMPVLLLRFKPFGKEFDPTVKDDLAIASDDLIQVT